MSDPTDIKALDEYLKGNSDVSQRYRELGRDEVPPELDRRVLAAARDAVANEGAKRSRSWLRWSAPVALAASIVLVLTVVLENGLKNDTTVLTQSPRETGRVNGLIRDKAANDAAEAKLADEVARQQGSGSVVPVGGNQSPTLQADVPRPPEPQMVNIERLREVVIPPPEVTVAQDAAPSASASVAPVPAAAPPAAEQAEPMAARKSVERSEAEAKAEEEVDSDPDSDPDSDSSSEVQDRVLAGAARRATGSRAGPRATVSSALTRETRPAADDRAERSDPQAWLEDIRELRRTGKTADADREWLRFRKAFPDFHVADDDIAPSKP